LYFPASTPENIRIVNASNFIKNLVLVLGCAPYSAFPMIFVFTGFDAGKYINMNSFHFNRFTISENALLHQRAFRNLVYVLGCAPYSASLENFVFSGFDARKYKNMFACHFKRYD